LAHKKRTGGSAASCRQGAGAMKPLQNEKASKFRWRSVPDF